MQLTPTNKRRLKKNLCQCGCGQACYNRFVVGHNSRGTEHSEETKQKMSESHKGKPAWNKGVIGWPSEETRKRMSRASNGRKWTEESKHNLSLSRMGDKNPMYGRKVSEEVKNKLSRINKGKKISDEQKIKISIGKMRCRTDDYCDAWSDNEYKDDCRKDICSDCGMTNDEHIEKWNRVLGLHHKDGKKENCHPNNFDTLCVSCHAVADWKLRESIPKDSRGRWLSC